MAIKLSNADYPIGSDTEIGEFRTELDADYAVAMMLMLKVSFVSCSVSGAWLIQASI